MVLGGFLRFGHGPYGRVLRGEYMDYQKYYEAREIVREILEKDFLGPLAADEVIKEYPVTYYIVGKLYPQKCRFAAEWSGSEDMEDLEDEPGIALDNGSAPSSMGFSFSLAKQAKEIRVSAKAALYRPQEETESETKKNLWKREPVELPEQTVWVKDLREQKKLEYWLDESLKLVMLLHREYPDGSKSITATLINTNIQTPGHSRFWVNQHTYFQPEIRVSGEQSAFTDVRKHIRLGKDKETREMEMLYSNCRNYAAGHGCAADYKNEGGRIVLYTSFLPVYELNQMMPYQSSQKKLFSMKYLSEAPKSVLISELKEWLREYMGWIDRCAERIGSLKLRYQESARQNMEQCRSTYHTMIRSADSLKDEAVYKAFVYANEAMYLQRKQMLKNRGIVVDDDSIRWYPFQLAFFLQEVISFANPGGAERKQVDLLWFPTGGGKTEAYLGIAAFVIFLRRLRGGQAGSGVSVIMRYTLRLLTFQQFERASAMICACEQLRVKYRIPGDEISIGLWAGKALTPNTIEMADRILRGYSDPDNESSNPVQLEKCPWCGAALNENNYTCDKTRQRMVIRCGNPKCEYHNGLPVHLIDEAIYRYTPTFLVATVDKFAQVAQNEQTFALFGKNSGSRPPELIIQGELHLISGPLGTITGIYEAAFKRMFSQQNINAKVIASTATIKNAGEQINSLYGMGYTQFPPQGLDADDSYFAVKSTKFEKPSRMYMGCMGTGSSATNIMVRVMAAVLFATRYLEALDFDEEIIDSFWTITSYFNTLRELGGAIVRVVDNVQARFGYLKETKFREAYPIVEGQLRYDHYIELTSREKSENIGRIIQNELLVKYTKDKVAMPYDFILSSNMISVGIDIARLNTMLMVGQPKTTAEYIQATSRVGRETPGFVLTMYNCMRSRDQSHFEQFCQYHEAFYKYVEATSVTPFAERARDRALQALYVMLCRFYIDELTDNSSAGKFHRDIPGLQAIRTYILDHVSAVDPDEYENVEEELDEIEQEWEALAEENPDLTYRKDLSKQRPALFKEDYREDDRFRVLNSMRSVETSIQVIARESYGI